MDVWTSKGEAVCPVMCSAAQRSCLTPRRPAACLANAAISAGAEERLALPQVGVIALGVVNSLPAAVGWNELKRNRFIELVAAFARRA